MTMMRLFILAGFLLSAYAPDSHAQSTPEIEVNLTVLQDVVPGTASGASKPLVLTPPREEQELMEEIPHVSQAVSEEAQEKPVSISRSVQGDVEMRVSKQGPDSIPAPNSASGFQVSRPAPLKPETVSPAIRIVEKFPVQDAVRTETANPAAPISGTSKPVPVAKQPSVAGNLYSVPVPIRETVSQKVEEVKTAALPHDGKVAPIPPRRPQVQRASRDFVDQARNRQAEKLASIEPAAGQKNEVITPVRLRGKPTMPAVRKDAVAKEPIGEQVVILPELEDPLLDRLSEKGKNELAGTIEMAFDSRETSKPLALPPRPVGYAESVIIRAKTLKRREQNVPVSSQEQAILTPMPEVKDDRPLVANNLSSLLFSSGVAEIDDKMIAGIDKALLPLMQASQNSRLSILSYATEVDNDPSSAGRISLARALAVRKYLVSKGIEPSRIDLKAMGEQSDGGQGDRVDLSVNLADKG